MADIQVIPVSQPSGTDGPWQTGPPVTISTGGGGGGSVSVNGTDVPDPNFNDAVPATAGNVKWRTDGLGNVSAYAPAPVEFTQSVAAAIWNITHNLGLSPAVVVQDSTNTQVLVETYFVDANNVRLLF